MAIATPLRHSLTLVSRFFHIRANPILYQTIVVADYSTFGRLRECLELNARRAKASLTLTKNAHLIRRVHIKARSGWPQSLERPPPPSFTFRHLTILTTAGCRFGEPFWVKWDMESIVDYFLIHCASLVAFGGMLPWAGHYEAGAMLRKNPKLKMLCAPISAWNEVHVPTSDSTIDAFLRLQAITIAMNPSALDSRVMTALLSPKSTSICGLRLRLFWPSSQVLTKVEQFGSRITFLDLPVCPMSPLLDISAFTNLKTLVASVAYFALPNRKPSASVERLALADYHMRKRGVYSVAWKYLCSAVFPNLGLIRVVNRRVCRQLVRERPQEIMEWSKYMESSGTALEAFDGRLLATLVNNTD